ncbi:hypothetical protein L6452_31289 [Arctium lappa]|uniref:Uncharacterized protein n=1 Tax=Arctium lappa TaxID=4217 RepID=A0ACB8ZK22_ARCLA|nr:hypothetical protein L6452_31289 [Arctium lappa]
MDKLGLVGHLVPTEKEKIKAYIKGLPSDMMSMVRVSKAFTLREAIEEAQLMEDAYNLGKEEGSRQVEKRRWEGNSMPSKKPRYANNNHRGVDPRRDAKWCSKCRISTSANVTSSSDLLQEPGHVRAECPKLKTGGAGGKKVEPLRTSGRSFQMTVEETKASNDVVSDTFLLKFIPARVLFDSGASYSFISDVFYPKLSMSMSSLEDALVVEIMNGSQVVIQDILRGCTLEFEGKKFPINLMPMQIGGFDVVVGMDWL